MSASSSAILGLHVQVLVDVAERGSTSFIMAMQSRMTPIAMPACSRMNPARIFAMYGPRVGEDHVVANEHVAELDGVGAGAVHREEGLARLEVDALAAQSARTITGSPASFSKMVPKTWSGPRFDTQGSAPRTI